MPLAVCLSVRLSVEFFNNPGQNEANSMLEKEIHETDTLFQERLKITRESNFTYLYNPIQNEAKSMLEIKFMKQIIFSKKGSKTLDNQN